MKTLQEIKKEFKSDSFDGRDLQRLAQFIPEDQLVHFGLVLNEEFKGTHEHSELTKDNILQQLKKDVEFGFEKALNKRGLSASAMNDVVKMWNWVLQDGLENFPDQYAMYGLPLLKATAIKYGFDNPIGDDDGDEEEYQD